MYLQVTISAETQAQAGQILNSLLEKKLVTGGQIIHAPARFLWKNKITNMDYFTINSFTIEKNKAAVVEDVKRNSIEEIPMVWFFEIDGNDELLKWIKETLK